MRRYTAILVVATLAVAQAVTAAQPSAGVVSPSRRSISWTGGPLLGASTDPATCVPDGACDEFALTIAVPPSYWRRAPGGVAVRVEWSDPNDEIDLHVFDAAGKEVANSLEAHTTVEQALIYAPAPGRYRIVIGGLHSAGLSYRARAWIARVDARPAAPARSTMRFTAPGLADPQIWASEPGIWAAADGAVYTTAIWSVVQGSSLVWRSSDGGRTFALSPARLTPGVVDPRLRPCSAAWGGGDADIITDRTGRVYFSDLYAANMSVGVSTDKGRTWACNPVAATTSEDDRQWLAPAPSADGSGPNVDAYLAYKDLVIGSALPYAGPVVKPASIHLDRTIDGGLTWQKAATYATDRVGVTGPVFTAGDGTIYHVFQHGSSVWLARSTDLGRTMRLLRVSDRIGSPARYWVAGDVDAAGNVYVAWIEQGSWDVLVSSSRDRGLRWSAPVRVNPPSSESATMPWLAAGKGGDVAVAWYGAGGKYSPDDAPASARWHVWVARSLNGTSSSPRFETARISETPVRFGPLCSNGILCTGDRKMGDFFEIDIARDGAIVAAYSDTARIQETLDGFTPSPYVVVTRQTSGLGMRRAAPSAAEPAGDADPPDEMAEEAVEALDITALPGSQAIKGGVRLSLRLSSTKALTDALAAANTGIATDAYWMLIWKANDRVEYAGLHVDRQGRLSFFGGDAPASVGRPDPLQTQGMPGFVDKMASYPETFSLSGRVDEATGQIFIDVPMDPFHLRPGDVLHSVQAFSMTSLLEGRTFLQPLLVVDSTPARSIRLR